MTFVDGQTKDFLKSKLRDNQLLIWRSCVEASIYCAMFHEIKKFLKNRTANHRWVQHSFYYHWLSSCQISLGKKFQYMFIGVSYPWVGYTVLVLVHLLRLRATCALSDYLQLSVQALGLSGAICEQCDVAWWTVWPNHWICHTAQILQLRKVLPGSIAKSVSLSWCM